MREREREILGTTFGVDCQTMRLHCADGHSTGRAAY